MIGLEAAGTAVDTLKRLEKDEPHWMAPDADCMGNPIKAHWRQFLRCSDGEFVVGCGDTAKEAADRATLRREKYEGNMRMSPEDRLKILFEGDLGDTDQKKAIRLLIDVVLQIRKVMAHDDATRTPI